MSDRSWLLQSGHTRCFCCWESSDKHGRWLSALILRQRSTCGCLMFLQWMFKRLLSVESLRLQIKAWGWLQIDRTTAGPLWSSGGWGGVVVHSASLYQHKTHLSGKKYGKFHPMAPCYMCSCGLGSFTTQSWYRPRCMKNQRSSWDTTRRGELRKTNCYWPVIDLNKLH